MTTFTTEDRIIAEKDGSVTINVEPIPFAGMVTLTEGVPKYKEMNNEPVAWMSNGKEFYVQKNYCPDFIPLYTHPAKAQEKWIHNYKTYCAPFLLVWKH